MPRKPPGLFITGSDTGVGKTYVAALIARALREQGHTVGVYKPAATGCRQVRGQLVSSDARILWQAAGRPGKLARVCPQSFKAPLAPPLAAAREGRAVDRNLLRSGIRYWQQRSDFILVEGAGGLMSPISDDDYNADVAYDLGYPLVIVVANRIGAINQALQTLIVAATFKEGIQVSRVVLNQSRSDWADDPSTATNGDELAARIGVRASEVCFGATDLHGSSEWLATMFDGITPCR
jgi:dethiobiotin synthetase